MQVPANPAQFGPQRWHCHDAHRSSSAGADQCPSKDENPSHTQGVSGEFKTGLRPFSSANLGGDVLGVPSYLTLHGPSDFIDKDDQS